MLTCLLLYWEIKRQVRTMKISFSSGKWHFNKKYVTLFRYKVLGCPYFLRKSISPICYIYKLKRIFETTLNYKILLKRLFLGLYKHAKMGMVAYFQFNQITEKKKNEGEGILSLLLRPKILCISTKYKGVRAVKWVRKKSKNVLLKVIFFCENCTK